MANFTEEFKDNENNWFLQNDDNLTCKISDGYFIEYKHKSGYAIAGSDSSFDFSKPFHISATIDSCTGPNTESYYGVVWNLGNLSNFYKVLLSPDGCYAIWRIDEGNAIPLQEWKGNKNIIICVAKNKLDIIDSSGEIKIFINNKPVQTIPRKEPYTGKHIGFIVGSKMKIRVRKITFENRIYKINSFISSISNTNYRQDPRDKMIMDVLSEELDFALGYAQRLADPLDEGRDLYDD